ncbi:MAG: DNA primase large subunit PriL [Methanomassiliicoccales archaeon]|jgi:DNA primase large subunit|nr:DNA primase large subunit PriL [Methanomassiliicoccales archaeon]
MEAREFARYPFLGGASSWVKQEGVELEDLLTHSAFQQARMRGKKRVLDSIEAAKVGDSPMATEEDRLLEVLSYPLARILVSCVGDGFLVRRYALAEAKTAYDRMQTERLDLLMEIAQELGVQATLVDDAPSMHFSDFLRFTSAMRDKRWKLVNTEVRRGMVSLPKVSFARVLEQALYEKIEDELPLPVAKWMVEALRPDVMELKRLAEEMKDRYQAEELGEVDVDSFPPCMKRLVAMAQAGENISHPGRFALTSFLFNIGLSREEILKVFSGSPDFDASKTKYQIDHITGEISGTTYTPPECSTMRTNAVCFNADDLCMVDWVKHPLIYYRYKVRKKRRQATGARPRPEGQQVQKEESK